MVAQAALGDFGDERRVDFGGFAKVEEGLVTHFHEPVEAREIGERATGEFRIDTGEMTDSWGNRHLAGDRSGKKRRRTRPAKRFGRGGGSERGLGRGLGGGGGVVGYRRGVGLGDLAGKVERRQVIERIGFATVQRRRNALGRPWGRLRARCHRSSEGGAHSLSIVTRTFGFIHRLAGQRLHPLFHTRVETRGWRPGSGLRGDRVERRSGRLDRNRTWGDGSDRTRRGRRDHSRIAINQGSRLDTKLGAAAARCHGTREYPLAETAKPAERAIAATAARTEKARLTTGLRQRNKCQHGHDNDRPLNGPERRFLRLLVLIFVVTLHERHRKNRVDDVGHEQRREQRQDQRQGQKLHELTHNARPE